MTAAQLPKPGTGTPWHGFVLPKFGERYAAATRRKWRRQLVENKVERLVPGVGVNPVALLKRRKLLILRAAEYAKNAKSAKVGYAVGTRNPK